MTAQDNLLSAAGSLLPSNLPGSTSANKGELDLRFLEASESLVLSLVLDPDSPYYIAKLVVAEILSSLNALLSEASEILSVLRSSQEKVDPPAVDRHFALAEEAAQRIGSRVGKGVAPETEDISSFVSEMQNYAQAQLVPQEITVSQEAFRSRLAVASESIGAILPDVLRRLDNTKPSFFFVDRLALTLIKSKPLSVFISRLQGVLATQKQVLTTKDSHGKAEASPRLLAEAATMIALVRVLGNIPVLDFRYRLTGAGVFASSVDGVSIGNSTSATLLGDPVEAVVDGAVSYLPIVSGSNTLEIEVDEQSDGTPVTSTVVALPVSAAPATVVVLGSPWTTTFGFVVSLSAIVSESGVRKSYFISVPIIPVYPAPPTTVPTTSVAYAYDAAALTYYIWNGAVWTATGLLPPAISATNYAIILNGVGLTEAVDGSAGPSVSSLFTIVALAGPARLSITLGTGAWRRVGSDISIRVATYGTNYSLPTGLGPLLIGSTSGDFLGGLLFQDLLVNFVAAGVVPGMFVRVLIGGVVGTYLITAVTTTVLTLNISFVATGPVITYEIATTTTGNSRQETGLSPVLADVVSSINAAIPTLTASSAPGRRLRITANRSGVDVLAGEAIGSRLRVVAATSPANDVLNLPTALAYGTVSAVYAENSDFQTAGISPTNVLVSQPETPAPTYQVGVDIVVSPVLLTLDDAVPSTSATLSFRIYAAGALSYRTAIDNNSAAFLAAYDNLLKDVARLDEFLGRAVYTNGDRIRAETYVLTTIGDLSDPLNDGPAKVLVDFLEDFEAPESDSAAAAIRSLRERGFDRTVDLLLFGDVESAFIEDNASYSRSLREVVARAGLDLNIQ